jgi:hypothetical protein
MAGQRRRGHSRPLPAAVLGLVASLTLSTDVAAALWLQLDRTSGPVGAVVHGRTGGNGPFGDGTARSLDVFIAPETVAESVVAPDDPRLVAIGALRIDEVGNGELTFTVPHVAAGRYTLVLHCPSCAEFSAGRVILPVANLTVAAAPDTSVEEFIRPPLESAPGALLVVACLAGLALAFARVRRLG